MIMSYFYSMFFGNLFVYFKFQGKTMIDEDTRFMVFLVLLGLSAVGIVFLLILRPAGAAQTSEEQAQAPQQINGGPLDALKRSFALFLTPEMLFLSLTFFYTGKIPIIFIFKL